VYIGNGEVIEAMGTKYGVVKTQLSERSWTAWLQIPYINYISEAEATP
jgi:cell wall-associated NlpC family hydrolase